ncbi:MAG: sulfur carrier protein ThiS [Dinoroseobacter sp.]|nr:sulfur carrier protein ThiS [Dinoroseobacter sp.]
MQLQINGCAQEASARTLDALLRELGYSDRVATAVNEAFVPKAARANTRLTTGDRIEILAPMQGG